MYAGIVNFKFIRFSVISFVPMDWKRHGYSIIVFYNIPIYWKKRISILYNIFDNRIELIMVSEITIIFERIQALIQDVYYNPIPLYLYIDIRTMISISSERIDT